MDNFARGYFYSYNPQDGPVYGISSFIHGVLSGFFAFTHLFSPLNSMLASNFIGLFIVGFVSLKILQYYIHENSFLFPAWILLMLSSEFLLMNSKQGLESPIHLAIVLTCFLSYLFEKEKMMWLFSVLAVISKTDALPIVFVLSMLYIFKNRGLLNSHLWRTTALKRFLLYFILPLLVWIVFSIAVFGSPVPQSAYAKYYYHKSSSSHWFPYLESLFAGKNILILIALMLSILIFISFLVYKIVKKKYHDIASTFIYGISAFAYIMLYYFYNPEERMGWYYVVPSFLISLQMIVLVYEIGKNKFDGYPILTGIISFLVLSFVYLPHTEAMVERVNRTLSIVESERIAIGYWIKERSNPADTLLTGFGHIARNSNLYTIDYTGLNSKLATDLHLNLSKIVRLTAPRWIAADTLLDCKNGVHAQYELKKSFFNLAMMGKQTWRVYERTTPKISQYEIVIDSNMLTGSGKVVRQKGGLKFSGDSLVLSVIPVHTHVLQFVVGIIRKEMNINVNLQFTGKDNGKIIEENVLLEKRRANSFVEGYTKECVVRVDKLFEVGRITITAIENGDRPVSIDLLDPILITRTDLRSIMKICNYR